MFDCSMGYCSSRMLQFLYWYINIHIDSQVSFRVSRMRGERLKLNATMCYMERGGEGLNVTQLALIGIFKNKKN